jgi:hypothetical protein
MPPAVSGAVCPRANHIAAESRATDPGNLIRVDDSIGHAHAIDTLVI